MKVQNPQITLHQGDLPADVSFGDAVAIDTEAMGLDVRRDRLCVVQLSAGDGTCHLVQIKPGEYDAPNLRALLENQDVTKLFHYGRFDMATLYHYIGAMAAPIYCTKIASRLCRTYTDGHGLKALCKELLGVDLSKEQQSSDWGADTLSDDQMRYAASDVLYLHRLRERLDMMLAREGRTELARDCMDFLPTRVRLDLGGWPEFDIFAH